MTDHIPDELSVVGKDPRAYTDTLRPLHGIVRNAQGEWVLLRHALVVQAALDHERFSNAVSSHLQIPNGLDADEHTAYRAALDVFLDAQALAPSTSAFAASRPSCSPRCRAAWRSMRCRSSARATRCGRRAPWLSWPGRSGRAPRRLGGREPCRDALGRSRLDAARGAVLRRHHPHGARPLPWRGARARCRERHRAADAHRGERQSRSARRRSSRCCATGRAATWARWHCASACCCTTSPRSLRCRAGCARACPMPSSMPSSTRSCASTIPSSPTAA